MTQTFRTFVAIELEEAIRQRVASLIQKLAWVPADVKWVEPHNLHLTLKFLGDVEQGQIARVCEAVARAAAEVPAFEFELRSTGAFPNLGRPRTIWVGAGEGQQAVAELARYIEKALEPLGYPREGRRFQAHLTIGRVRRGGPALAELADRLQALNDVELGRTAVEQVVVFSSRLSVSGPTYEALGRAALGGE